MGAVTVFSGVKLASHLHLLPRLFCPSSLPLLYHLFAVGQHISWEKSATTWTSGFSPSPRNPCLGWYVHYVITSIVVASVRVTFMLRLMKLLLGPGKEKEFRLEVPALGITFRPPVLYGHLWTFRVFQGLPSWGLYHHALAYIYKKIP